MPPGQEASSRGPSGAETGVRGHASVPSSKGAGRRERTVVADQDADGGGDGGARLLEPEVGVARQDPGTESVGQGDRRLGEGPGVERGVEDPGDQALGDDVGHGGVEVLVEVGSDLGEVRVADAQQGQLLPEQPLVRALLVAGQAPVEEGRQPFGGSFAGTGHGALVELGGDSVRVGQHFAEEELLGVEVVVQQAGRHPSGAGDRGHPDLGQTVADDAVGGRGEDLGARLRGRLLALGGPARHSCCAARHPAPTLLDCSVSQ